MNSATTSVASFACGDVIQKKKRSRTLDQDVIPAMINKNSSQLVCEYRQGMQSQFRSDTISRSPPAPVGAPPERAIVHAAKLPISDSVRSLNVRPRQLFDLVGRAVAAFMSRRLAISICSFIDMN